MHLNYTAFLLLFPEYSWLWLLFSKYIRSSVPLYHNFELFSLVFELKKVESQKNICPLFGKLILIMCKAIVHLTGIANLVKKNCTKVFFIAKINPVRRETLSSNVLLHKSSLSINQKTKKTEPIKNEMING